MTMTRWKLLAGVFGLSIGGLAAMAGSPLNPVNTSRQAESKPVQLPTAPGSCQTSDGVPIPVPAPSVAEVADDTTPIVPGPLEIPTATDDNGSLSIPVLSEPQSEPAVIEMAPAPRKVTEPVAEPVIVSAIQSQPTPEADVNETNTLLLVAASADPLLPPAPQPEPQPALELPPASVPASEPMVIEPAVPQPEAPRPIAEPPMEQRAVNTTEVVEDPEPTEKKLRVVLNMGDDRPRFEVRDDDNVLLKVVCERVDVKSPAEGAKVNATMRAIGKVYFVTPGGEGICDELSVVPGTGQVLVNGNVRFKYNWGKLETEVTGEQMNFRLTETSASPIMPASYERK